MSKTVPLRDERTIKSVERAPSVSGLEKSLESSLSRHDQSRVMLGRKNTLSSFYGRIPSPSSYLRRIIASVACSQSLYLLRFVVAASELELSAKRDRAPSHFALSVSVSVEERETANHVRKIWLCPLQ